jgi:hypothetical protein
MRQLHLLKYLIVKEYPKYPHLPEWNNVNFNFIPVIPVEKFHIYIYACIAEKYKTTIFLSIPLGQIVYYKDYSLIHKNLISFFIGREDGKEYTIETNNNLNKFKGLHNIPLNLFVYSTIKILDICLTDRVIIALCPLGDNIFDQYKEYSVKWSCGVYLFYHNGIYKGIYDKDYKGGQIVLP